MPRIEQDSLETDDMELPFEHTSENEYDEEIDEKTKNKFCVHNKKQQEHLKKLNGNNVNEISLPPPCKFFPKFHYAILT